MFKKLFSNFLLPCDSNYNTRYDQFISKNNSVTAYLLMLIICQMMLDSLLPLLHLLSFQRGLSFSVFPLQCCGAGLSYWLKLFGWVLQSTYVEMNLYKSFTLDCHKLKAVFTTQTLKKVLA